MVKGLFALFFYLAVTVRGLVLSTGGEYHFDNYVFDRKSYSISAEGALLKAGTWDGTLEYTLSRMNEGISGLSPFRDENALARLSFKLPLHWLAGGMDISAGIWNTGGPGRSFFSGEIPLQIRRLPAQLRFMITPNFRSGTSDDNPVATRIGVTRNSIGIDAGFGFKEWEVHATYQKDRYSSVNRVDYQPLLADTLFFQTFYDVLNPFLNLLDAPTDPIPANNLSHSSIYFFGPLFPWLYLGGAYIYKNSSHDFYLPIADTDDGQLIYSFFPYRTPKEEGVFRLVLDFVKSWHGAKSPVNEISSKVDFPVYSHGAYRGYSVAPSGNLIEGFEDFYYQYNGLGELIIEAGIGKIIGYGFSLKMNYSWFSRPYTAYHFFGTDSYQYHTIGVKVIKDFGVKD